MIATALPLPLALLTQIRSSLTKANLVPSGDHASSNLPSGPVVTGTCELPSADDITQICVVTEGPARPNAIFVPSGDQAGSKFSVLPKAVNCRASLPSEALAVQISPAMLYASFSPFGDHEG